MFDLRERTVIDQSYGICGWVGGLVWLLLFDCVQLCHPAQAMRKPRLSDQKCSQSHSLLLSPNLSRGHYLNPNSYQGVRCLAIWVYGRLRLRLHLCSCVCARSFES
jgi:hypothetical protein